MDKDNFRRELLEQARALMFNTGSDAAALAFKGGESMSETGELQGLDLTALASIHRAANGAVDIKFIDRIKLLELLLSAEEDRAAPASDGFMQALDRAAQRLGGGNGRGELHGEAYADSPDAGGTYGAGEYGGIADGGDEAP